MNDPETLNVAEYDGRGRYERVKLTDRIRPISYLKAHAAEIIRDLSERQEPLVVTQNGEAKAVMMDIVSYDQLQETMALLKILALGNRQGEEGLLQPATDAIAALRESS